MHRHFDGERFHLEYKEDRIDRELLWESHCHAEFELISVLEGDVSIILEGFPYRLTDHCTAIVSPLRYHTIRANRHGSYRRITALFDLSAVPEVLRPHFLHKDASLPIFSSDAAKELRTVALSDDPAFYAPLTDGLMIRLLYGDAAAGRGSEPQEIDETLGALLAYVNAHIGEQITLSDLAVHVARSSSAVSHLFREKMGVSPKQYILQKKLALAEQMIRSGMPPTVAAVEIGYDNYSNFYRMYKKQLGVSPSDRRSSI